LTVRRTSGQHREHGDVAGPIVADVDAVTIRAHSQHFGMTADVNGIGHALDLDAYSVTPIALGDKQLGLILVVGAL
jgi:hypothetical protein